MRTVAFAVVVVAVLPFVVGCGDGGQDAAARLSAYQPVNGYWFGPKLRGTPVAEVQTPVHEGVGTLVYYNDDPDCRDAEQCPARVSVATRRTHVSVDYFEHPPERLCWRRMRGVPVEGCHGQWTVITGAGQVFVEAGDEHRDPIAELVGKLRTARAPRSLGSPLPSPDCADPFTVRLLSNAPARMRCPAP